MYRQHLQSALLTLLLAFALLPNLAFGQAYQPKTEDEKKLYALVEFMKTDGNIRYKDITSRVKSLLPKAEKFLEKPHSYQSLKLHYTRVLQSVLGNYKQRPFKIDVSAGLSKYSGNLKLSSGLVHYLPFVPISPETYKPSSMVVKTMTIDYPKKKLQGIRFETAAEIDLPESMIAMANRYSIDLSYTATVNARVMGFTHARLIPFLSKNVIPAAKFEYNGQRDWSQHSRYKRMDQIVRPVQLTNWTHQSGSEFSISAHPDFALTLKSPPRQDAVLTYFLWKDGSIRSKLAGAPKEVLPDFVAQVVFKAPLKK